MKLEEAIRQERFPDNLEKAIINILFTANWFRDLQNSRLKKYDLLIQHYNALRIIKGRYPGTISPGEIKEVMLDKANDVTRLLDKLVEMGLITRTICEANRRRMDIALTPQGLKFLKKVQSDMESMKPELQERLSDKEAGQLSRFLDHLRG